MTFQNVLKKIKNKKKIYQINLPVAICVIKLICLPKG